MAPATFANLCKAAKIALPSAADRIQFLTDAGIKPPANAPSKELIERCATLAWSRDSLANTIDPETWPTTLDPVLLPVLLALYAVPPHRGAAPAPSDYRRLADVIETWIPAGQPGAPPPQPAAAAPLAQGALINISRPAGPAAAPPAAAAAAQQPPTPAPNPTSAALGKRAFLLGHTELAQVLPAQVYWALDLTANMSQEKRAKLHNSLRGSDLYSMLDNTTSAVFGHHTILVLADGQHFDAGKRGLALAGAGRSASASTASAASLTESCSRDTHLRTLQSQWNDMRTCFGGPAELSSTHVNHLWMGVTFVMTHRAARAMEWLVPEVELACRQQLTDLTAYRASVAAVIARVSSAYTSGDVARAVNRAYLLFFLPFWWEHVLLRGALAPEDLEREARALLQQTPDLALPAPTPPPPPTPPPAPLPPPAYHAPPAHPWPPLQPYYQQPTPAPGPTNYAPPPPAAAYPPPQPTPPPRNAPQPGARPPGFCGKTLSPLICGNNFGATISTNLRLCHCAISRAFPGRTHYPFECPLRYYSHHGRCPGWTAAGTRVPGAWAGDDITTATQAEWRAFQPTLSSANAAGPTEVTF